LFLNALSVHFKIFVT